MTCAAGLGGERCRAGETSDGETLVCDRKECSARGSGPASLDKQPHLSLLAISPAPLPQPCISDHLPPGPGSLPEPHAYPLLGWPPKVQSHWEAEAATGELEGRRGAFPTPHSAAPPTSSHISPGSGLLTSELLIPLTLHSPPHFPAGCPAALCPAPCPLSKKCIYLFMIVLLVAAVRAFLCCGEQGAALWLLIMGFSSWWLLFVAGHRL